MLWQSICHQRRTAHLRETFSILEPGGMAQKRHFKAPNRQGTTQIPAIARGLGQLARRNPYFNAARLALQLAQYLLNKPGATASGSVNIPGWTQVLTCDGSPEYWHGGSPNDSCNTKSFQVQGWHEIGDTAAANAWIRIWAFEKFVFGLKRYKLHSLWRQDAGTSTPTPQFVPLTVPWLPSPFEPNKTPLDLFLPSVDPIFSPIHQPTPAPLPLPYPFLPKFQPPVNPNAPPGESTRRGNSAPVPNPFVNPNAPPVVQPSPNTAPQPAPAPGRGIRPRRKPLPAVGPSFSIGAGGTIKRLPPGHAPVPPGPGQKQRKFIANLPPGFLSSLLNAITEGVDVIDAIWRAIPNSCRNNNARSPQAKAVNIYRCAHVLNVPQAIVNLIAAQASDKIIGTVSSLAGQSFGQASGSPVGPGTGPAL